MHLIIIPFIGCGLILQFFFLHSLSRVLNIFNSYIHTYIFFILPTYVVLLTIYWFFFFLFFLLPGNSTDHSSENFYTACIDAPYCRFIIVPASRQHLPS